MIKHIKNTILGGLLSASITAPALAGEIDSTEVTKQNLIPEDLFSFSTGYHSKYVWRGIDFGSRMADWSLDAGTTVSGYDVGVGVWAANVFSQSAGSEVDLYASIGKDYGFAKLELGYIFYYFDGLTSGNTQEIYLSASKSFGSTTFSATWYRDIDLTDNSYLEFAIEQSISLGYFGDVDASLVLGTNPEDKEFTHIQPTVSKSFSLNSQVDITPYISYSHAIENIDANGVDRNDEFLAGVSIGFSF